MNSKIRKFTKNELQVYILLLCANADANESEEELNLIKSKVDLETFGNIYREFSEDSEEERFEKIEDNIRVHKFSTMQLANLRKEMYEIFFADCKFTRMERNLDKIMDNVIY